MYQAKRRGRRRWELYNEAAQHHAMPSGSTIQEDSAGGAGAAPPPTALPAHHRAGNRPTPSRSKPCCDLTNPRSEACWPPLEFIDIAEDSQLIIPSATRCWARPAGKPPKSEPPALALSACRSTFRWPPRPATWPSPTKWRQPQRRRASHPPPCSVLEMTERVLMDAGDSIVADLPSASPTPAFTSPSMTSAPATAR